LGRPFFAVLQREGMSLNLRVFFEDPFWVGLFTISEGEKARYCRVVFGGEPSDTEIYDYLQRKYNDLKFSELLPAVQVEPTVKNPKRRQREAAKNLSMRASEKKSYEVIKQSMQLSQKALQKTACKEKELESKAYIARLKRVKKIEKHKGH
jgi:hypothetical protein